MTALSCAAARPLLQAYHDEELPVPDQIAVAAHVSGCAECRAELAELEDLGDMLRREAPGHMPLPCDEARHFAAAIVNRARVEDNASFVSSVRGIFDDRRVVYSALGATVATLACLVVMLGMMHFGASERTDSLAGMLNVLSGPPAPAQPLIIRPIFVDARITMPRALEFSASEADESVLALSGVVTSEGRVSNIEVNDGNGGVAMAAMDAKRIQTLVTAMAQTRFEPVMKEGDPVAVNMVWFVAHTTVRGSHRHLSNGPRPNTSRRRSA